MIRRICKNLRVQWLEEVFDRLLQKIFIDMYVGYAKLLRISLVLRKLNIMRDNYRDYTYRM